MSAFVESRIEFAVKDGSIVPRSRFSFARALRDIASVLMAQCGHHRAARELAEKPDYLLADIGIPRWAIADGVHGNLPNSRVLHGPAVQGMWTVEG